MFIKINYAKATLCAIKTNNNIRSRNARGPVDFPKAKTKIPPRSQVETVEIEPFVERRDDTPKRLRTVDVERLSAYVGYFDYGFVLADCFRF